MEFWKNCLALYYYYSLISIFKGHLTIIHYNNTYNDRIERVEVGLGGTKALHLLFLYPNDRF